MFVPDVVTLVGTSRRRSASVVTLLSQLQGALTEEPDLDGAALSVAVSGGVVTVRGEVGSLDQITRTRRVIERFRGGTEIVNLVRMRASTVAYRSL